MDLSLDLNLDLSSLAHNSQTLSSKVHSNQDFNNLVLILDFSNLAHSLDSNSLVLILASSSQDLSLDPSNLDPVSLDNLNNQDNLHNLTSLRQTDLLLQTNLRLNLITNHPHHQLISLLPIKSPTPLHHNHQASLLLLLLSKDLSSRDLSSRDHNNKDHSSKDLTSHHMDLHHLSSTMALQEEDLTVPVHMVHDKVLRDSLLKVVLASHLKVLRDLDQMELLSKVALTHHHLHLLQVVMLLQLTDQNQLVRLLLPTDHHPLALLKDLQQLQPNLLALLQLDHNPLAHHLLVLKEASPMDLVLQAHHPLVLREASPTAQAQLVHHLLALKVPNQTAQVLLVNHPLDLKAESLMLLVKPDHHLQALKAGNPTFQDLLDHHLLDLKAASLMVLVLLDLQDLCKTDLVEPDLVAHSQEVSDHRDHLAENLFQTVLSLVPRIDHRTVLRMAHRTDLRMVHRIDHKTAHRADLKTFHRIVLKVAHKLALRLLHRLAHKERVPMTKDFINHSTLNPLVDLKDKEVSTQDHQDSVECLHMVDLDLADLSLEDNLAHQLEDSQVPDLEDPLVALSLEDLQEAHSDHQDMVDHLEEA